MDGYYHEDLDALERRIHAMMAEQALPRSVVGYDVEFGNYMDGGDPAVWVNLHTEARTDIDWDEAREVAKSLVDLRQKLVPLVPSRLALIALRRPPAGRAAAFARAYT